MERRRYNATDQAMASTNRAKAMDPAAERLRIAFELFEAGVEMERLRLKRLHPQLSALEVEALWLRWLHRVGEPGDAEGSIRPWPRSSNEPTS